jgi:hypothetical protein
MTRKMYGALSGLPAIPNIVFGPIGGMLVDWIGAGMYVGAHRWGKSPRFRRGDVSPQSAPPQTQNPHHNTPQHNTDKACVLYSVLVVLGSALSSIAVPLHSTKLLGVSQVLIGVGRGTLQTAQKVTRGVKGREGLSSHPRRSPWRRRWFASNPVVDARHHPRPPRRHNTRSKMAIRCSSSWRRTTTKSPSTLPLPSPSHT